MASPYYCTLKSKFKYFIAWRRYTQEHIEVNLRKCLSNAFIARHIVFVVGAFCMKKGRLIIASFHSTVFLEPAVSLACGI